MGWEGTHLLRLYNQRVADLFITAAEVLKAQGTGAGEVAPPTFGKGTQSEGLRGKEDLEPLRQEQSSPSSPQPPTWGQGPLPT